MKFKKETYIKKLFKYLWNFNNSSFSDKTLEKSNKKL